LRPPIDLDDEASTPTEKDAVIQGRPLLVTLIAFTSFAVNLDFTRNIKVVERKNAFLTRVSFKSPAQQV
jgi:hypothetical protein